MSYVCNNAMMDSDRESFIAAHARIARVARSYSRRVNPGTASSEFRTHALSACGVDLNLNITRCCAKITRAYGARLYGVAKSDGNLK